MRLRTLPLSLSGVLFGLFIALSKGSVDAMTIVFLILTTIFLQVLSNLSNELGDTLHGTDTAERAGMRYSIMDGEMTVTEMERLIRIVVVCCCLSGLTMIRFSFGTFLALEPLLLILLGACAIWAAMHYTLGDNPYGYRGLGDIFVFIFFGIVSVCGGYYVCSHDLSDLTVLLPAAAIGCFSVGVLNVNNIRDMKTDIATRSTIAIKMGNRGARIYQIVLIALGWAFLITYNIIAGPGTLMSWSFLGPVPIFIFHLRGVWERSDRDLDPMLPLLVMSTFFTALLYGAGILSQFLNTTLL